LFQPNESVRPRAAWSLLKVEMYML
jgi:hypothetical protein